MALLHKNPAACSSSGKLHPGKNLSSERKVRFEESEKPGARKHAEKPWLPKLNHGSVFKDKLTGELLPFGERAPVEAQKDKGSIPEMPEIRLKGKLKWLFEQDRMFWASNSKSSRRSTPDVDLSKVLRSGKKSGESNDIKVGKVEGDKDDGHVSRKSPLETKLKKINNLTVSREEGSSAADQDQSTFTAEPIRSTATTSTVWSHGDAKLERSRLSMGSSKRASKSLDLLHSSLEKPEESVPAMSSFDLGGDEFFTDYEDGLNSGDSSEYSSPDEYEEPRENSVAEASSVKELAENETRFLKLKCDLLSKEKDNAVRKWKQSCVELDQAARMAQALRSAIETLLQAGDPKTDVKSKQDNLEVQTQVLNARMEKLRRRNSEGVRRHSETKRSSRSLDGRIEMLTRTSERSLASPEVPRGTENTVEDLRARLEKLMLATNSRAADDPGEIRTKARSTKKKSVDRKNPHEKGELKMESWYNSLSAGLTTDEPPYISSGGCDSCDGGYAELLSSEMDLVETPSISREVTPSTSKHATPFASKQETPFASKQATPPTSIQVSPLHPVHESPESTAPSSEETKKNVIHKIAEEVRLEAEQWFQVQELLQRVGEDMKSLHEACDTWERRAVRAEAQVALMTHQGQEKKAKAIQLGDERFSQLQREMLRLSETVEEVRKQLGGVSIDPSRWFEAATKFGYAFVPVNLFSSSNSCACKGKCSVPCSNTSSRELSDKGLQQKAAPGNTQPSSSTNSMEVPLSMGSREKTSSLTEVRRRSQLPSQQWAKEIARAEEEEILTGTTASRQSSKLSFVNSIMKGEMFSASGAKVQEKPGKHHVKDPGLETSGSRGDLMRQMQPSARERCILHEDEQLPRYANFNSSLRRSPLRDVLENIASSKENKRPF